MVRTASSLTFDARRHFLGTAIATCALCVLSHGVSAQVIYVPGDYDDLQEAIDAAPPDATIVTDYGPWTSIRITKPLTLIGGSYRADCSSTYIRLAGPGHGKVVLSNIASAGYVCYPCAPNPGPGVAGGGFDELAIYDSRIYAPFVIPCGGRAFGTSAVLTDIPFVVLERCLLVGSRTDDSELTGYGSPGPPGIDAPGSTVLVLDSFVQGGDSGWFTTHPDYGYLCDDVCRSGRGGPGIAAATLYHSGSTLVGGAGAIFDAYLYEGGPYGRCPCRSPDGVPVASGARATELPKDLKIRSNFSIGSTLELSYAGHGPGALFFSFGLAQPRIFPDASLLFLRAPQYPLGVIAGQLTISVPRLRSLIGRRVAFQVFNRLLGATRPVGGVFR